MTPASVGFIVVALVPGAAEMAWVFSGARKNRLDLSVVSPWAALLRSHLCALVTKYAALSPGFSAPSK